MIWSGDGIGSSTTEPGCRTTSMSRVWPVGRVTRSTSIRKMRPWWTRERDCTLTGERDSIRSLYSSSPRTRDELQRGRNRGRPRGPAAYGYDCCVCMAEPDNRGTDARAAREAADVET